MYLVALSIFKVLIEIKSHVCSVFPNVCHRLRNKQILSKLGVIADFFLSFIHTYKPSKVLSAPLLNYFLSLLRQPLRPCPGTHLSCFEDPGSFLSAPSPSLPVSLWSIHHVAAGVGFWIAHQIESLSSFSHCGGDLLHSIPVGIVSKVFPRPARLSVTWPCWISHLIFWASPCYGPPALQTLCCLSRR